MAAIAVASLLGSASTAAWSEPKDIRWGTGPVGSSGHKALVVLANLLNKEMPDYRISVLPLPGAVMTVKGYATGEYRGLSTAPTSRSRNSPTIPAASKASRRTMKRAPVQSFWCLHARCRPRDQGQQQATRSRSGPISTGKKVYTGPLPFDTRLQARARAGRGRRQAHLHAGRSVDRRLAAQLRRDRGDDHLHRRRQAAGAVDLAGLARGRLGRAQSERRRTRDSSRRRASSIIEVPTRRTSEARRARQERRRCCRSTGASTSASKCRRTTCTRC